MVVSILTLVAIVANIAMMIYNHKKLIEKLNDVINIQNNLKGAMLNHLGEIRTHFHNNKENIKSLNSNMETSFEALAKKLEERFEKNETTFNEFRELLKVYLESIKSMKDYFDQRQKDWENRMEYEKNMRQIAIDKYNIIMSMKNEGKKVSEIAKILTDVWGYKVTSNDIDKLIHMVGEDILANENVGMYKPNEELPCDIPTEEKTEYKVDETVVIEGEEYIVKLPTLDPDVHYCDYCEMNHTLCHRIACMAAERSDSKNVIFTKATKQLTEEPQIYEPEGCNEFCEENEEK